MRCGPADGSRSAWRCRPGRRAAGEGRWPCRAVYDAAGLPARSVEQQDRPRHLAGFHCPERVIDVAQYAAAGNHRVEIQTALAIELQIVRNVGAELVRTHP